MATCTSPSTRARFTNSGPTRPGSSRPRCPGGRCGRSRRSFVCRSGFGCLLRNARHRVDKRGLRPAPCSCRAADRFFPPVCCHPLRPGWRRMKALPVLDRRHLPIVLAALFVSGEAFASADLARSKNCVACHHAERRGNGPAYTAIAARYANDSAAVGTLSERVLGGTGGNWGPMPMPPQSTLSRDELETLVRWILSHQ